MISVQRSITIRRPVADVQRQFADVAYHERTGHHRGVTFIVDTDDEHTCHYRQETKVGPLTLRQSFVLDHDDPAHQVNRLESGTLSPGSITFDIAERGPDETEVTATLTSESTSRAARLAAPLLRAGLGRALAQALDEDRDDLESGRYAHGADGS